MTDLLLALGGFTLFLVTVSAAVGSVGYWILAPMHRATRRSHRPAQFFVSDFVWLVVQLQLALSAVLSLQLRLDSVYLATFGGASWLSVLAVWWASVTALSRAGVRSPPRRAAFILVVVPVASLGTVAVFLLNLFGLLALLERLISGRTAFDGLWLMTLNLPAAAVFYGCRRLAFWVLDGGDVPADSSTADSDHLEDGNLSIKSDFQ